MTHDTPVRAAPSPRLGSGLGLAVVSAASFGLSGSLARGLLDAGWTAGAAVTVRIVIAALVLLRAGATSRCAAAGRCCAATPALVLAYGLVAVAGCQLALLQRGRAHAGRRGAADRVHRAGRGDRLALAAARPRPGRLTDRRRRGRRSPGWCWSSTCSPARTSAWSACSGRSARWSAPRLLRAVGRRGQRPAADRAGRRRTGGRRASRWSLAGLVGVVADGRRHRRRWSTSAPPSPWWLPVLALGVVTAALAYVTGIAAGRRLGSRLASFVALLEVRRRAGVRLAAARRAAPRASSCSAAC